MSQVVAKEDRYLSDFQEFDRDRGSLQPRWVREIREQAFARFSELGLPTARRGNEKWKYTSVAPIANATLEYPFDPDAAPVKGASLRRLAPWSNGWVSLVFVDGHYSEALSVLPSQTDGIRVASLAGVLGTDGDLAEVHLGQYATFDDDAFTALNTAFLSDGAFVHLPDESTLPSALHLVYLTSNRARPTVSHPRTLVVAGRHSKLTMIESYVGRSSTPHLTNAVTEIAIGDGAEVEHYRLLMDNADAFHVGCTRVSLDRDSTFSSSSFTRGVALARNDLQVLLDAPGSSCFLRGLYMTSGTQHIDNYINIDHAKPHTTSRLYYKGILDGKSRAVFGGTVMVRPDAQKADSQQTDKNLLLSEHAEVDSKPSLLIYADDVKCSHGATAGNIDEDAVFYMKSRGLDRETAGRLLIEGFAGEIIETVRLDPLRAHLNGPFLGTLPKYQIGRPS